MIGIIGAMSKELKYFLKQVEIDDRKKINGLNVISAHLNMKKIIVVQSGIGKVNAALATQFLIDNYHPRIIINFGSCGSSSFSPGDVIIANQVFQFDFDLSVFGDAPGYISELKTIFMIPAKSLINKVEKIAKKHDFLMNYATIGTSDHFVFDMEEKSVLLEQYGCTCFDMESAAFAQVCLLNKTPWLSIKIVSDAGGDHIDEYFKNIHQVSKKLALILLSIIEQL